MTGISAFVGKYMKLNFDAFEDWVNSEGGIKGRPRPFHLRRRPEPAAARGATRDRRDRVPSDRAHGDGPGRQLRRGGAASCRRAGDVVQLAGASSQARQLRLRLGPRHARRHQRRAALLPHEGLDQDRHPQPDRCHRPGRRPRHRHRSEAAARTRRSRSCSTSISTRPTSRVSAQIERIKTAGAQALIAWTTGSPSPPCSRA